MRTSVDSQPRQGALLTAQGPEGTTLEDGGHVSPERRCARGLRAWAESARVCGARRRACPGEQAPRAGGGTACPGGDSSLSPATPVLMLDSYPSGSGDKRRTFKEALFLGDTGSPLSGEVIGPLLIRSRVQFVFF